MPDDDGLHRLAVLVRHNLLLRMRDPGHLISYLVMPMVLMLAFKPLYRGSLPDSETQTVVGMIVMFSALSLTVVGTAMLTERIWLTWDRLRVTPASVVELLLGKTIPLFVLLAAQQVLLLLFGCAVVGMRVTGSIVAVGVSVLVWSFAVLALGCVLAVLVRSHGELSAISDVGALTLSALGGAFAPVSMMPGWARFIAPVSPGYWATNMYRAAIEGNLGTMMSSAVVLCLIGVAAGALACLRINRGLSQLRG
jgi:ABC-2 type transport system permease protein